MGSLFDEVAGIGREFLNSTGRGHQVLLDYQYTLSQFCDLLSYTHDMVIRKLEAVEDAKTPEDVRVACQELQGPALTSAFRSRGLCDIFQGFSGSLGRLLPQQSEPGRASSSSLFSSSRTEMTWRELCDVLMEREARVADVYVQQIEEIGQLASRSEVASELQKMRDLALQAKTKLTLQKADFDALAQAFRSRPNK